MPVTAAQIDAAVPPAGTPNRGLTNTALKGLITDIAAVGVGIGIGTVNTFADLPAAASHTGERWWVLTSTGVWLVNRKTKGAYYSDGAAWSYLGDFPITAAEIGNVPAGGIAATDVQAAIDELDTEKASLTAIDPLVLANDPTTPASGSISVGQTTEGGYGFLKTINSDGIKAYMEPKFGRNQRTLGWLGANSVTTLTALPGNGGSFTVLATATARAYATTSFFTRTPRVGWVSAASAGAITGPYTASAGSRLYTIGTGTLGGFLFVCRFGTSDAATVAGARMFVGVANATAAPTNVNPSTLTDVIGIAQIDGSTNLHIVFGGSAAQTPVDLGVNFPANTLSVDLYEFILFSHRADNTKVTWQVTRCNTGDVTSGTLANTTPGTTLPGATTALGFRGWRTNNAALLAVGLDISSVLFTVDYGF